jgi:hypothetical protein
MGEQQQLEVKRLQARLADAEQSEQAAMESHSRALKAYSDAEALHRQWAESKSVYEPLLRDLPMRQRAAVRADEDLLTDERLVKNVVTPLEPSAARVIETADRRPMYAIVSCAGIAMLAAAYLFFTMGPLAPKSRPAYVGAADARGARSMADEEVVV